VRKISKRRIGVVLAIVLPLLVVVLVLTASQVGVTSKIGSGGLPLSASDLSMVPQSVTEDATKLATELFGDVPEEYDDFVNQLLGTYLEAKDKDFVIVFNSGGWGWNLVEASPGWWTIFTGIETELNSSGHTSLLLNYQRTVDSWQGRLDEIVEILNGYSSKSENLACRIEFLTTHIPDLRVILAGESTGAIISDQTMNILADNPDVYSIQTGPPFWHENIMLDRTLVMTDNGLSPDAYSQGDLPTMIRANLRALFGLDKPNAKSGTILRYILAPGHEYWWEYPGVYPEITNFLFTNFSTKY
jgi:hypothetical protein